MNQAELHVVEGRVINWARWANSGAAPRMRCASAEGKYLPPAADEDKLEFLRANPINVLDAEKIERCICSLPSCGRVFIVLLYVKRVPVERLMKKFHIEPSMFEAFRLRNLKDVAERAASMDEVVLIRRGRPIWAGLAK